MKRSLLLLAIVFGLFTGGVAPLQAQDQNTAYVRDMLYVVLRESPGDGAIVRSGIPSGTAMEILEVQGDNSRVRLEDGYTGWVSNQYLSSEPAARTQLEALQAEMAAFEAERAELQATAEVVQQLGGAGGDVDVFALQSEIATLRAQSARYGEISAERDDLLADVQRLQALVAGHELEVESLKNSDRNAYFLRGAGAVLLGVLIALIVPALKPKKRNEWA